MNMIVNLTGISSGNLPTDPVTITGSVDRPDLFSDIAINYVSPNPTGTIILTPVSDIEGIANMMVTVKNTKPTKNTTTRAFKITIKKLNYPTIDPIPDVIIEESSSVGNAYYVDNSAMGLGNGTSWINAWKSFADINWSILATNLPCILYISGGATSKIYNETLTIGANGVAGKPITIDVGANSPYPLGHDGQVIIDGGNIRPSCVYIPYSYISINGANKLLLRNAAANGHTLLTNNASHLNLDYIQVDHPRARGITITSNASLHSSDVKVNGCYIATGDVANNNETDCIYSQYVDDVVIENNTIIMGNKCMSDFHSDGIQFANSWKRLTIRNNHVEIPIGKGNLYCMAVIVRGESANASFESCYIYNNVLIGNDTNTDHVVVLEGNTYGGKHYVMNNTVVAQIINGGHVFDCYGVWTDENLGLFKNNILYCPNGVPLIMSEQVTPSRFDHNCLYRYLGTSIQRITPSTYRTWAQYQTAGYDPNGINIFPDYNVSNQYRLNATSKCKNAGADLSAYFTTDKDGNLRPIGNWSIGAYQ